VAPAAPAGLDSEGWTIMRAVIDAIREALTGSADRKHADVLGFVLDAIRAHKAKVAIDN
jgi:hypothetical protein